MWLMMNLGIINLYYTNHYGKLCLYIIQYVLRKKQMVIKYT